MVEMHNLSKFNLPKANLLFLMNIQAFLKIQMKVWLALQPYLESQANGIFHPFFFFGQKHTLSCRKFIWILHRASPGEAELWFTDDCVL